MASKDRYIYSTFTPTSLLSKSQLISLEQLVSTNEAFVRAYHLHDQHGWLFLHPVTQKYMLYALNESNLVHEAAMQDVGEEVRIEPSLFLLAPCEYVNHNLNDETARTTLMRRYQMSLLRFEHKKYITPYFSDLYEFVKENVVFYHNLYIPFFKLNRVVKKILRHVHAREVLIVVDKTEKILGVGITKNNRLVHVLVKDEAYYEGILSFMILSLNKAA